MPEPPRITTKPTPSTGEGAVVAIVRFGAAGDVIRIAPAIEAMALAWPQARRLVVTHARFAPLMARCRVDIEHVPFAAGEGLQSLARRLRTLGVTHVLDLHGTLRSRLLALRLWPRPTATIFKRGFAEWARVRLAHAPHRPKLTCAARQQQAIFCLTGHRVSMPQLALRRPMNNTQNTKSDRPRIGLSPGAAWATKRWPSSRWVQVAQCLHDLGYKVSIFGSESEALLVSSICRSAPHAIAHVGLSWNHFSQELGKLSAFVSGDSGPLHLAMALQVPSVGLFFSTPDEAFDEVASHVIKSYESCRPCSFYGQRCCPRGHGQCWTNVLVQSVLDSVSKIAIENYHRKTSINGSDRAQ